MMQDPEIVQIQRECEAIEIPSGRKMKLYPGTEVRITQALGGTFTVVTLQGVMASIQGLDAGALGKEVPEEVKVLEEGGSDKPLDERVMGILRTCYDPEIPHNIVDLGLIYNCHIEDLEGGKQKVEIRMTLTAPGCGMGEWLKQDIEKKIASLPDVGQVVVDIVFDPPWDHSKMHPALRRQFFG